MSSAPNTITIRRITRRSRTTRYIDDAPLPFAVPVPDAVVPPPSELTEGILAKLALCYQQDEWGTALVILYSRLLHGRISLTFIQELFDEVTRDLLKTNIFTTAAATRLALDGVAQAQLLPSRSAFQAAELLADEEINILTVKRNLVISVFKVFRE